MGLLSFQKELFEQIRNEERGFWIVASGIGLDRVLFASISDLERSNKKKASPLLYIFLNVDQNQPIYESFLQMAPNKYKLINSDYTSEQRCLLYNRGGICFISSRVLVIDLLKSRIPFHKLGGLYFIMPSNYMISESSTEAFILRLYAENVRNAKRSIYEAKKTSPTKTSSLSSSGRMFDGYNESPEGDWSLLNQKQTIENEEFLNFETRFIVKAFCENPLHFSSGFNKLSKVCKYLHIGTKVFLWPRFRKSVSLTLETKQPQVVQLHVHLAKIQEQIHKILMNMFSICLKDLRRKCGFVVYSSIDANLIASHQTTASTSSQNTKNTPPSFPLSSPLSKKPHDSSVSSSGNANKNVNNSTQNASKPTALIPMDSEDLSFENALFSKFYSGISSLLEPLGDRVPFQIRKSVFELNSLRKLIHSLIRHDAVQFYEGLQRLRTRGSYSWNSSESNSNDFDSFVSPPQWLFFDEAADIFDLAQSRLYKMRTKQEQEEEEEQNFQKASKNSNETFKSSSSSSFILTLEDNPKWKAIVEALDEIGKSYLTNKIKNIQKQSNEHSINNNSHTDNNPNNSHSNDNDTAKGVHSSPDLFDRPVLIIVKDEENRRNLSEYLSLTEKSDYLLSRLKRHLQIKSSQIEAFKQTQKNKQKPKENYFDKTLKKKVNLKPKTTKNAINSRNQKKSNINQSMKVDVKKEDMKIDSENVEETIQEEQQQMIDEDKNESQDVSRNDTHQVSQEDGEEEGQEDDEIEDEIESQNSEFVDNNQSIYSKLLSLVEKKQNNNNNLPDLQIERPGEEDDELIVEDAFHDSNEYERYFGLCDVKFEDVDNDYVSNFEGLDGLESLESVSGVFDFAHFPSIIIHPCSNSGGYRSSSQKISSLLSDIEPHFVILVDCDQTTIREIECFKASKTGHFLRMYMIIFSNSFEEDRYVASIHQEQRVFRRIAEEKAALPKEEMIDEQEMMEWGVGGGVGGAVGGVVGIGGSSVGPLNSSMSTRQGGIISSSSSSSFNKNNPINSTLPFSSSGCIIVDMREFRSKLPGILHSKGFQVVPQTLVIADYILTPQIAVERKSLPDLKQSFASGRLYQQMMNLVRLYSTPILLIEFDASQAFQLQSSDVIEGGIYINSLSSKLVLLTKQFPKMRILWSRSPFETASLFLALKQGKPQPNSNYIEQSHSNLPKNISSHYNEEGEQNEEGNRTVEDSSSNNSINMSNRKKGRNNQKNSSAQQQMFDAEFDSSSSNSTVSDVSDSWADQNLALFESIDMLKRLPGLRDNADWKKVVYGKTTLTTEMNANNMTTTSSSSTTTISSNSSTITNLNTTAADDDQSLTENLNDASPPSSTSLPSMQISNLAALATLPREFFISSLGPQVGLHLFRFLHFQHYQNNPQSKPAANNKKKKITKTK